MVTFWPRDTRPEKQIQAGIIRELGRMGFHVSNLSQVRASMVTIGLPDLFAQHPVWRISLFIEVKAAQGRVSPAQVQWHAIARRAGVTVVVARNIHDVVQALQELGAPIQVQGENG